MNAQDTITRLNEALSGRYLIERELGVGGMATVYLARDIRHEREVAIKVLAPNVAATIGPARFLAEIRTIANLQHPHILGLIDSGDVDGTAFYVMPYVDEDSLRDRLRREHQLPVPDAVRIATDVAGALDYAHRHRVIHRDIKPENILLHEGKAFVADFGIALAMSQREGSARLTETGLSLGTPQYMSPEQAMGERDVDGRTDIYSLGCVLYEMLTGAPPFTGASAQAVVAKVLSIAPEPVTATRRSVPANVEMAVAVALEKIPADRFATANALAAALGDRSFGFTRTRIPAFGTGQSPLRNRQVQLLMGAIAVLASSIALLASNLRRTPSPSDPIVGRFELTNPVLRRAVPLPGRDGRLLWGLPGNALLELDLSTGITRQVRDSTSGGFPLSLMDVSTDGRELLTRRIGGSSTLEIVPLHGGGPRTIAHSVEWAAWGDDGLVYYAFHGGFSPSGVRGIARVRPTGNGVDTLVTVGDTIENILRLLVLPGSHAMLAQVARNGQPIGEYEYLGFDLRRRAWKRLGVHGRGLGYVEPGYILYSTRNTIMAARFSADRLELGEARPLVVVAPDRVPAFRADEEVLVYRSNRSVSPVPRVSLGVVDTKGIVRLLEELPEYVGLESRPTLSPDGTRLGMELVRPESSGVRTITPLKSSVAVYELPDGPLLHPKTSSSDHAPLWMPGGREISFIRIAGVASASYELVRRPWNWDQNPAAERTIHTWRTRVIPQAWLDDKQLVVEYAVGSSNSTDIGLVHLDRPDNISPLVTTPGRDTDATVSRDGQLLAYTTDASGSVQVFVRRLQSGPLGEALQVSRPNGRFPRWGASKELYFTEPAAGRSVASGSTTSDAAIVRSTRIVEVGGKLSVGAMAPLWADSSGRTTDFFAALPGDTTFFMASTTPRVLSAQTGDTLVVIVNLRRAVEKLFGDVRP